MNTDDELLAALAEATNGLMMLSESDHPFEIISFDAKTEITPEFLRTFSKENEAAPVAEQSVDEFFRAAIAEPDWKKGAELETAKRFQTLVKLLKENLSELKVYRVGQVNVPVYLIGRSHNQTWLGLSTRVVET